jgi:hypothetical protein
MNVNYLEKQVSLTGSITQDSVSVVAEWLKGLLTRDQIRKERVNNWQLILLQSKANGCFYHGKNLPHNLWAWPKHTWFQERLSHYLKALEFAAH